jgi:hypothetical protein
MPPVQVPWEKTTMNSDWPDGHPLARVGGVPTPASVFPQRNATEPPIPVPDGKVVVRTVYGKEHVFYHKNMPNGWKPTREYLQISTLTGYRRFPWGQILWFDTVQNSKEFNDARQLRKDWEAAQHAKAEEEEGECDA